MTGPNKTDIWTFYGKPIKDGQAGSGQIEVPSGNPVRI
jgi:hypothetical protein